jgi:hypothetical protein
MLGWNPDSPKLPFGRYRGRRLDSARVPGSYLRNLYSEGTEWLWPDLRSAIHAELIRRGLPFGR